MSKYDSLREVLLDDDDKLNEISQICTELNVYKKYTTSKFAKMNKTELYVLQLKLARFLDLTKKYEKEGKKTIKKQKIDDFITPYAWMWKYIQEALKSQSGGGKRKKT